MNYLNAVLYFTDTLGQLSYVARNCYLSRLEFEQYSTFFKDLSPTFPELAAYIHANTANAEQEVNTLGWDTFVKYTQNDWIGVTYDASHIFYLLTMSQMTGDNFNVDSVLDHKRLRSLYPYDKAFNNRFYLYFEMAYEFIVGARVVNRYYLDLCEIPVTAFFTDYQAATDFRRDEHPTEGFLMQLDTFRQLTPVIENCWQTYWRSGDAFRHIYLVNQESPVQIYINLVFEFVKVVSDMAAITADLFFEDWLSLSFYLGDCVYRLLVVQHQLTIQT